MAPKGDQRLLMKVQRRLVTFIHLTDDHATAMGMILWETLGCENEHHRAGSSLMELDSTGRVRQ